MFLSPPQSLRAFQSSSPPMIACASLAGCATCSSLAMQEPSHCNCGERYSFNEASMLAAYTLHCHRVNSYYCSPRSTHALASQSSTGGTARQLAQAMFTAHQSPFPSPKPPASSMLRTNKSTSFIRYRANVTPATMKPFSFQSEGFISAYVSPFSPHSVRIADKHLHWL